MLFLLIIQCIQDAFIEHYYMLIPGLYILVITLGAFRTGSTILVNKCMAYWLILAFGADTLKFEQSPELLTPHSK